MMPIDPFNEYNLPPFTWGELGFILFSISVCLLMIYYLGFKPTVVSKELRTDSK